MKYTLFSFATFFLLAACGLEETKDEYDIKGLESVTSPKNAQRFTEHLRESEHLVGFPATPRRSANFTSSFSNTLSFFVGVKTDFFGAEAASITDTRFDLNFRSTLILIRTVNKGSKGLTTIEQGQVVLNVEPEVGFIGFCNYSASASVSKALINKLDVYGTGVNNVAAFKNLIEVSQNSHFFPITETNTLDGLRRRCLEDFKSEVQWDVIMELKNLIQSSVTYSRRPESDMAKSVRSAVHGPNIKGVYLFGQRYNVKKARYEKRGNTHIVSGQLSHHIRMWPDRQIHFTYKYRNGKVIEKIFNIGNQKEWQTKARKIADILAEEVYLEHRDDFPILEITEINSTP